MVVNYQDTSYSSRYGFFVIMQFMILSLLRSSIFLRYTVLQPGLYLTNLLCQLAHKLFQIGPQGFDRIFLCHNPAIPCPQVPGCIGSPNRTNRLGDLDSNDAQYRVGFSHSGPKRTGKQGGIVPPPFVPDSPPVLGSCRHVALSSDEVLLFSHSQASFATGS